MTGLDTATPEQHRARYEALRAAARARATLPRRLGAPAPAALPEDRVLERETIPGGWYWTVRLARGTSLRLVNDTGTATVAAALWHAEDPSERLNVADTVKLQWTALIGKGLLLFSDMGRVLASITEDSSGRIDLLAGGSTPASNLRRYGDATLRNSRDNLRLAAGKLGLSPRDVPPAVSFFAGLSTDGDGRFHWRGDGRPGELVELRAELDLLVALSACPHPLDPRPDFAPAPVTALVWASPPPADDDPCRSAGEEARRGFENNDAYRRGRR